MIGDAVKNFLAGAGVALGTYVDDAKIRALIASLRPVTTERPLIRLGGDSDGGYLVPDDLDGLAACFSPGVDVVASFERDLAERSVDCFLADASVEAPPITHERIHFERKFLGVINDDTRTTLDAWAARHAPPSGDLILQMDIEGAEWPVLLNVSDALLSRFRILVLEVHDLHRAIERSTYPLMAGALERLTRQFHVVHLHPNNVAAPLKKNGLIIPRLMEMTFLRKDRAAATGMAVTFPHPLDRKNRPDQPDFPLPTGWYSPTPK